MNYLKKNTKIFLAGHKGMVGSAIFRSMESRGFTNVLTVDRALLDLTNSVQVFNFFKSEQPEVVFIAAAKVGGIKANNENPSDFILENLRIQNNLIEASFLTHVKRLLFLGSSCIYPKNANQPIKEEYLLTGPLEKTNRAYAVAKIAGIELCSSYNRQFGSQFVCAMPTNLYGIGDNYHSQNSHVIPGLLRRIHEAKSKNDDEVIIWGSGQPKREFLFSEDLAEALLFIMNLKDKDFGYLAMKSFPIINIGSGFDLSIKDLAIRICNVLNYKGSLTFDPSFPDGTPRKLIDSSNINKLGWEAKTDLNDGLLMAYADFLKSSRI